MQQIKESLAATGLEVTTSCVGHTREDYTDIPAVRATVGLVPEETRSDRVRIISEGLTSVESETEVLTMMNTRTFWGHRYRT